MRLSERRKFPKEPYRPGQYLISLRRPVQWYVRRVGTKGKTYGNSNIKTIIPLIACKVFCQYMDEEELDLALNLDCFILNEADEIKKYIEDQITAEVLAFFPRIGSSLSDEYWWINDSLDLVINVPQSHEEQRGNFI